MHPFLDQLVFRQLYKYCYFFQWLSDCCLKLNLIQEWYLFAEHALNFDDLTCLLHIVFNCLEGIWLNYWESLLFLYQNDCYLWQCHKTFFWTQEDHYFSYRWLTMTSYFPQIILTCLIWVLQSHWVPLDLCSVCIYKWHLITWIGSNDGMSFFSSKVYRGQYFH